MKILKISTTEFNTIRTLFSALHECVNVVNMQIIFDHNDKNKNSILIRQMTPTKVALFNVKLNGHQFDKFESAFETLNISIQLSEICDIFNNNNLETVDNIKMYITNSNDSYFSIQLNNYEQMKCVIKHIPIISKSFDDNPEWKISLPDITFHAVIQMNSQRFNQICKNTFDNVMNIVCLKDKVTFKYKYESTPNTNTPNTYITNKRSSFKQISGGHTSIVFDNNNNKKIDETFDITILKDFSHSNLPSLCNTVEIYIRNNYPACIIYTTSLGKIMIATSNIGRWDICKQVKRERCELNIDQNKRQCV
ncbi:MAG: proliferating cell nuclear antigen [Homavirus sp.]|uniref:Proliferating cell nuclear antigen n=1 Tax=Homavirus sp. TaxID=2487769 RepID=A0A3G5A7S7_9VIRU|nr:MAG: proliferating cell nuclear antigen [Homavirus sp.]